MAVKGAGGYVRPQADILDVRLFKTLSLRQFAGRFIDKLHASLPPYPPPFKRNPQSLQKHIAMSPHAQGVLALQPSWPAVDKGAALHYNA